MENLMLKDELDDLYYKLDRAIYSYRISENAYRTMVRPRMPHPEFFKKEYDKNKAEILSLHPGAIIPECQ